jgi:hypothetical protein
MDQKLCKKCDTKKPLNFFNKDKSKKDGYRNSCKECQKDYSRNFYIKNKESICESSNEYYKSICNNINYKTNRSEYMNIYKIENSEKIKKYNREYNLLNKEEISISKRIYRENNKEKIKKYKSDNRDMINSRAINYYHNRIKKDEVYHLSYRIRSLVSISIKKRGYSKKSKTNEILGCSFEEFKTYLESKFEDWMTWDNKGLYNGELNYGWDIDHIIPISSAETEEDVIKLNHYTNLQPLCSFVNRVIKRDNMSWINVY